MSAGNLTNPIVREAPGRPPFAPGAVVVYPLPARQGVTVSLALDQTRIAPRSPWAKVRILETANELFYQDGIRTVGVDRLISSSSVTKATFYKHYGSKDKLINDYITGRHQGMVAVFTAAIDAAPDAEAALRALLSMITADISRPTYRGCPFLNAAAEFPEAGHVVRKVIAVHRDWLTDLYTKLVSDLGHPMAGDAADEIMLAMDGAQSGGYAGDPIAASAALNRVVERVIADARQ